MFCYTQKIVSEKQIIYTLTGPILPPYKVGDETGFRINHP